MVVSWPYHSAPPKHRRRDRGTHVAQARPATNTTRLALSASQEVAILVGLNLTSRARSASLRAESPGKRARKIRWPSSRHWRDGRRGGCGEPDPVARQSGLRYQIGSQSRRTESADSLHEADVVIFDRELTPTQQRTLERALDVKVLTERS